MRITIFNGSSYGSNSNTHRMAEAFAKGAIETGAEAEEIFLMQKHISPCRACFNCWFATPGQCIIKDDTAELLDKIRSSDMVVFASPLYIDNVSGIMKNFMDRLVPLLDAHYKVDARGECYHPPRKKPMPGFAVISNCAFSETNHFQVLKLLFRRMARNFSTKLVAEIYLASGSYLDSTAPKFRPRIDKYKEMLRLAGKEIAQKGRLSKKTSAGLQTSLLKQKEFVSRMNRYFDKLLSRARK